MIDQVIAIAAYVLVLVLIFLGWRIHIISKSLVTAPVNQINDQLGVGGAKPKNGAFGSVTKPIVIVVLVSVAYYCFSSKILFQRNSHMVSIEGNDVSPGSFKAFLSWQNGIDTLTLQNSKNNELGQQGSSRLVKNDSQLVYINIDTIESTRDGKLYNTLITPKGGKYNLKLPDGTKLLLNAGSSITFPIPFSDSIRQVEITGEIFFEVAKKNNPFKISVIVDSATNRSVEIEVTGTKFNVNAYNSEELVTTTVIEGQVIQSLKGPTEIIRTVSKGQQASITNGDVFTLSENNGDIEKAMAWKNGFFLFRADNVQTVVNQLALWYDLNVKFEGDIPNTTYTGKIPRRLSLKNLVKVLNSSGDETKFTVEGNNLIVRSE